MSQKLQDILAFGAPKVSVVIPAYNEADFIRRALDSLQRQDCQDFEVIVVDNNSTDATAVIARQYGARVIVQKEQGVGKARQLGFAAARADIIATTDADTKLPPDWISRIISRFGSDPALLAYGGLYSLHSGPKLARWFFPKRAYWLWRIDQKFSGSWSLPGANMAVRASAFAAIGGFNQELQLGEDADLSQRLGKIGTVVLDRNFLVSTSGRRYRKGLLAAAYAYIPSAATRILLKKPKSKILPPVRKESQSPVAFVAPVFMLAAMTFLFFHSPVSVQAAKTVRHDERKMVFAADQMVHHHHFHFHMRTASLVPKIHGT